MMNSGGKDPSLDWHTLIDLLETRAKLNPDLRLFTFLQDGELEQGVVTPATLASQARSIAAWLESLGLGGKRILLTFPQGLEFIASFFGCIYAGAFAVPAPMPDPSRVARTLPRLQGILADAAPAAVLTNRDGVGMAVEVAAHLPELTKNMQWLAFEDCPWELGSSWHRPAIEPQTPTHLQYTSGSTSTPKGTIITHANVLANVRELRDAMQYSPLSRSVIWEPYFHDDCLIQGIIQPIFTGYCCFLMAPAAFVARPVRWLQAMSRYRATHTTGPNFAYELCIRKITDEERDKLDLSNCIGLQNAAEPVRAETLRRFYERFAPCGLRWNALAPNYGLAEATLCVAVSPRSVGPVIIALDSAILEREGRVRLVSEDHPHARLLPSSGVPAPETQIVIADPQTLAPCPDGRVGEILVKSAGVAAGYLGRPEESQRIFQARLTSGDGPYLRTGDQGFLLEGNLFITGRIKDLIIIRGENRYPQDIELSVERAHPAIAPGNIAAFSVEVGPEERLAVVAEVKRGTSAPHAEMMDGIRDAIAHDHELRPWAVALLAPGTLPKTSSGKIQRQASRKAFMDGTLQEVARWQEESRSERSADPIQVPAGGKNAEEIQAWLTRYLAAELGASTNEIGLDVPFNRFGLDSVSAVRLAADLGDWLGRKLEPVIAWNYPNILALSRHLQGHDDLPAAIQPPQHTAEPIAIIGASCRFPGGVTNLETFWTLLDQGVDAIGDVPRARWDIEAYYDPNPDADGKIVSRSGGFLSDIDRFEPTFFEISPREAAEMDPQQRLLLEVSWEAFENAGQTLAKLRGSNTGVYVGISGNEYQQLGLRETGTITPYLFLGTTHSTGVARLSYWLGLQGPNLPVNTACSSSLVAVHLACQALRNGECSMAIAGGVNLLLAPESSVCLSRMHALSPTGRCHSFSVDADGYVRSEGCGMVVLKRLSDAQRDGDPILAVIRGTAVNQDGRTNGLTAPNGPAQEDVIRRALSNASVQPHEIGYVETHGTGTPLGDPIEVKALARVLGQGRNTDQPICIGSVKTNIGHAESAAGIAGLLKVVLAISHGRIPSSLHFRQPSPHIPWSELPVHVVAESLAWTTGEKKRIAGVSSFGMSGTNAHIILEEPPHREEKPLSSTNHYLVPLSAKTPEALNALAKSYVPWLSQTDASLPDIAYTASLRRSHFEHRLSAIVRSKEELSANLDAYVSGQLPSGVVAGKTLGVSPKIVFVFSGQGSQWVGMGRQLFLDEPVFRDAMLACDAALRKETGYSIVDELHKPEDTSRLAKTLVAQPALFAIEVSLATLLQSWGIVPSAVIGHSVGEIAAAHIAGMLDLAQAARLVSLRARIMQRATGQGKMVSAALTEHAVAKTIAGLQDRVGIAAINDPSSVVLSGDIEAIDKLVEELSTQGVALRPLRVDYAFHSPQMEPLAAEFLSALGKVESKPATIPMISTVTGKPVRADEVDAEYWARNIRRTVRFSEAIAAAATNGLQLFIEVGPHPVLTISIEQTLAAQNANGSAIPTLRRGQDEHENALRALGALYVNGVEVDWTKFHHQRGRIVELPTYPWQRNRYWIELPVSKTRNARSADLDAFDHPLLYSAISMPENGELLLTGRLSLREHSWLADHRVAGQIVFPGTGFVELALAAAHRVGLSNVEELILHKPLFLSSTAATALRLKVEPPDEAGSRRMAIYARVEGEPDEGQWTRHAQVVLGPVRADRLEFAQWPPSAPISVYRDDFYAQLAAQGLEYGPAFRGLTALWRDADSVYAEIGLPALVDGRTAAFKIHPALLDAAIQTVASALAVSHQHVFLPFQFNGVSVFGVVTANARVQARITKLGAEALSASIALADGDGNVTAVVSNVLLKRTAVEALRRARTKQSILEDLYCLDWQESRISPSIPPPGGTWLLLGEHAACLGDIAARLKVSGAHVEIRRLDAWLDVPEIFEPPLRVLWFSAASANNADEPSPEQLAERLSIDALRLVQKLATYANRAQITFVTSGAVSVDSGESMAPAYAVIWGYGRTLVQEHPEFEAKLVDFSPSEDIRESLWKELCSAGDENQIAWRDGKRFAARLVKISSFKRLAIPEGTNYALEVGERGVLSNLRLNAVERRAPSAGEIEIEVFASGLNFRDVLNALGMYPGDAGPLGAECAGNVVAVGDDVHQIKVGDRVMALVVGAFRAFVTVDARLVALVPKDLSLAQAATIPIVFLTAYYALHDLAHLRAGESILIHAAAGGVGMAAVQIAHRIGANVLATASPSKWESVRAMGVKHVASSRNVEFADAFREVLTEQKVGVVLNSLAREFVDASLSLLEAGGRFLEMGKTDIRSGETIARAHPGVTYRAFDLWEAGPARIQEMLASIVAGFESGELRVLPVRYFPIHEAEAAFRFMAQARHTGKVALTAAPKQNGFSRGTVVVTGGLGALGLLVARHLWERHRVAHLALVGRSIPTGEKIEKIDQLRLEGAIVTTAQVDVSDMQSVRAFVNSIPAEQPLRGIIHAAGVLEDGIITEQTPERLAKVFGPKVRGAWNLYAATRDKPLELFVMFSSVAGVLGNAGQSSYAAANAFLDVLALQMRSSGMPAMSLAWGPWDGKGMAANLSDKDRARLRAMGLVPMAIDEALSIFDETLQLPNTLLIPMHFDPVVHARNDLIPPLLRRLVVSQIQHIAASHPPAPTMALTLVPESQRFSHTMALVRQTAAEVLGLPGQDAVPIDRSLFELGLDSLMVVELRNRIAKLLGIRLDTNAIMQDPRPVEMVAELLRIAQVSTIKRQTITIPPLPPSTRRTITIPPNPSSSRRSTLHPLSSAQTRLYFLDRILERRETYNLQIAIRVDAILIAERLRGALAKLAGRHEQLRMQVFDGPDGPQQRILPWVEIPVEEVDLRSEGEIGFTRFMRERAAVPFDLTKAPLLRVTLARLDGQSSGLLLVWHHIATDGWSIGRFLQELETFYTFPETQLPPVFPYHELVAARQLDDAAKDEHQRWWTKYLAGAEPIDLPTDRTPTRRERRGGRVAFAFDAAESDKIDILARTIGATPFAVLLSGWALVMQRYCRQEDVTIAVISSGRTVSGSEAAIGLFVETLPVRCFQQSDQSVRSNIVSIHRALLEAVAHERLPLDEMLGALPNVRRGEIGETPLLRVSFVLEHAAWFPVTFAGAKVVQVGDAVSGDVDGTNKFDLGLAMVRHDAGYRASIEYAADLFDTATIERLAGHLRQILMAMAASPENRLSDIEMLTATEQHQLLVEWNDTTTDYPAYKCIHELFEEQVERTPEAVAVIFGEVRISYADLDAQANQLAHQLRLLGVGPDVLVGLCLDRSIEMVVGLLGILKAGGAYVPLDPHYPRERLAFMLEDTEAHVVLTQTRYGSSLFEHHPRVLCMDSLGESPKEAPPSIQGRGVQPNHLAYVMYTSGSTGTPKGACITHRSVVRLVKGANFMKMGPDQTFLQLAPITFDASTLEIWGPLLNGGRLVVHAAGHLELDELARTLQEYHVSTLWLTAGLFHQFVEQHAYALSHLQYLLVGGDVVSPESARIALEHISGNLINGYGPTENTTFTACHRIDLNDALKEALPIGRPISNTQVIVVDSAHQIAPIGVIGHLCTAGDGLARGYLARPGLTAERFVPNPFSSEPGSRMYRTGDLARWNERGQLEFWGRIDNQIKIRGFRVELGEVETALLSLAAVRFCVVIAREDRPGDKRLVAYIVPNDADGSAGVLRAHLGSKVPDYMIPSAFVFLEAMPLTPNGKIDRKALPAPELDRAALSMRFVAARTRNETILSSIWSDVLGLDNIGIHDNFFELGGNSLLGIRLISRAAKAGLVLTVRQLFESPTIDGLAKALATNKTSAVRCLVPLRPSGTEIPLVLTPGLAGTSMVFLPLRDAVRTTIPLWTFDDPHLARHPAQISTIEELAHLWVAELLDAMPDKPAFRLGGYSFGGMVAVEMARQLIALGKAIECVLIFDGGLPNSIAAAFDALTFLESLARQLGAPEVVRTGLDEADIQEVLRRIAKTVGTWQESFVDDPLAWTHAALVAAENNHGRMMNWQVRPVDVPVVVLRAADELTRPADLGWSNAVGHHVQALFVPGDHQTMMQAPYVQTLAFCIDGLLAQYDGHAKRRS